VVFLTVGVVGEPRFVTLGRRRGALGAGASRARPERSGVTRFGGCRGRPGR
jgi:hypothetical protein